MNERILFVDDDPNILEGYQRKLQHVLLVRTALGAHAGLREILEKGPFAVVVADMNMPVMNGVEFLKKVRENAPDTVRMMLTGNADIKTAMDAVNEGNVFRFLTKPCPSKLMGDSLIAAIEQYRLITAEKELLEGTLRGTAELLTEILSWVNPDSFGLTVQLRNTAISIAQKMNVKNLWEIGLAATFSQLGVMAIPQDIMLKVSLKAPLTEEEKKVWESIPTVGHDLIERIPRLAEVANIVLYQNKHYNGEGYPKDGEVGEKTPIGARILKIASDFHELRSQNLSRQECITELKRREGWYDPAILQMLDREAAAAATPESPKGKVVPLTLQALRPGLTLASPILTSDEKTLVSVGTQITEAILIRLKKYTETNSIKEPIEVIVHK